MTALSETVVYSAIMTIRDRVEQYYQAKQQFKLKNNAKKYSQLFNSSIVSQVIDVYNVPSESIQNYQEDKAVFTKHNNNLHKVSIVKHHQHYSENIHSVKRESSIKSMKRTTFKCSLTEQKRLVKLVLDTDQENFMRDEQLRRKKCKLDMLNKKFSQDQHHQHYPTPARSVCMTKRPNFTTDYEGNIVIFKPVQDQRLKGSRIKQKAFKDHRHLIIPQIKITKKEKLIDQYPLKQSTQTVHMLVSNKNQKYDYNFLSQTLKSSAKSTLNQKKSFAKLVSTCRVFPRKNAKKGSIRASIDQIESSYILDDYTCKKLSLRENLN